jgi:site-specific recombinase XerD
LHDLKNKNLHPSTRGDMIGSLRVYLRWRYERELLRRHPDNLVQSGDFPKLPDYLPRPLSPDIDRNLQTFLLSGQRHFLYRRGLWLMRKTGLRIGELESLEFDCLRTDQLGNTFLKVPLGKLNNERLVPVTAQIVQLVTEIQHLKPTTRKYLLGSTVQNKPERNLFYAQLKYASRKFKLPALIQSHQLRHTCATELINSGMSLTSIMSFLGHKDFRMTLRYAKITQHTLAKEFHLATQQAETKYAQADPFPEQSNGLVLLANLIKWCQAQPNNNNPRVTKRLHRLKQEIAKLQKLASRAT